MEFGSLEITMIYQTFVEHFIFVRIRVLLFLEPYLSTHVNVVPLRVMKTSFYTHAHSKRSDTISEIFTQNKPKDENRVFN